MSRPAFADTRCARLRRHMAAGCWMPARELEAVGGRRFAGRLHEIARGEDGGPPMAYDYDAATDSYRLREYHDGDARPAPRHSRKAEVEALKKEVAELRERLAQLEAQARKTRRGAQASLFDMGGAT